MHAKVFLASFLATILAVGVIAAPQELDVEETPPGDVSTGNVFESVASFASTTAAPDPRPTARTITPGEDDVLVPANSAVPRDLVSSKLCSINWAGRTVTNFSRIAWRSELLGVLRRLLSRK